LPKVLSICWWHAVQGYRLEQALVVSVQNTEISLANAHGIRQHGLKNRLKPARRTADDLEHFGRCCLLLKGFTQLSRSHLFSLEQPCVLDGDYRLIGEGSNKVDLLLIEWFNPVSRHEHYADWSILSHEGDGKGGTSAAQACGFLELIVLVAHHVRDLHRSSFEQSSAGHRRSIEPRWVRPDVICEVIR